MPEEPIPGVTDPATVGAPQERTASDRVGVTDSAFAPPPLERSPERDAWQQKAADWITEKWTTENICPICASSDWTVTPPVSIRLYRGIVGSPEELPGGVFPMFFVMCGVCGYAMPFSAVVAGVLPRPRDPKSEAPEQ